MRSCTGCGAALKLGARACSKCNLPVKRGEGTGAPETRTSAGPVSRDEGLTWLQGGGAEGGSPQVPQAKGDLPVKPDDDTWAEDTRTVASPLSEDEALTWMAAGGVEGLAPSAPETQISDYEVVRELARGGMGVVYEVNSPQGSRLALKRIRHDRCAPEFRQRFVREGRVLQQLSDPGVVSVVEVGADAVGPYLVTEFVEGRPLSEILGEGTLSPRRAASLVAALCRTVQVVHDAGVLHRDIKPSNVMIHPDGSPVLIDFGLASVEDDDALTRTGTLLGTPAYASPEQVLGRKQFGPHTDVYGLGGILFTSLTNRPPHEGHTLSVVLRAARDKEPRWPSKRWIPLELERLGRVALRRDPLERYKSAAEFRTALVTWLESGEGGAGGA
jgi:serine/threonine protein kinase